MKKFIFRENLTVFSKQSCDFSKTHVHAWALPWKSGLLMGWTLMAGKDDISWPPWDKFHRQDELWKSSCCLEAFWQIHGDTDSYGELNISPSGAWNLYKFSSYRCPSQTLFSWEPKIFSWEYSLGVFCPIQNIKKIFMCGILSKKNQRGYMGWTVPEKPDFHNPKVWKKL